MALLNWSPSIHIEVGIPFAGDDGQQYRAVEFDGQPAGVLVQNSYLEEAQADFPAPPWSYMEYRPALHDMQDTKRELDGAFDIPLAIAQLKSLLQKGELQQYVSLEPETTLMVPFMGNLAVGLESFLAMVKEHEWTVSKEPADPDAGASDMDSWRIRFPGTPNVSVENETDFHYRAAWNDVDLVATGPRGWVDANFLLPTVDAVDASLLHMVEYVREDDTFRLTSPQRTLTDYVEERDGTPYQDRWDYAYGSDGMGFDLKLDGTVVLMDTAPIPYAAPISNFAGYWTKAHPLHASRYIAYHLDLRNANRKVQTEWQWHTRAHADDVLGIWTREPLDPNLHVVIEDGANRRWACLRGELLDKLESLHGDVVGRVIGPQDVLNMHKDAYEAILDKVPPVKGTDTAYPITAEELQHVATLVWDAGSDAWAWNESLAHHRKGDARNATDHWDIARTLSGIWDTQQEERTLTSDQMRQQMDHLVGPEHKQGQYLCVFPSADDLLREWRFPDGSRAEETKPVLSRQCLIALYGDDGCLRKKWWVPPATWEYRQNDCGVIANTRPPPHRSAVAAERQSNRETESEQGPDEQTGERWRLGY